MKPCCRNSAKKHLKRALQAATCDACGNLLLAYGEDRHLEGAKAELAAGNESFEEERIGDLDVIAKPRARGR